MDRRRCCTYQEAMIVADVLVMSGFTSTARHSTSTATEGQNLLLPCTAVCVTSCEYTEPTLRHIIHNRTAQWRGVSAQFYPCQEQSSQNSKTIGMIICQLLSAPIDRHPMPALESVHIKWFMGSRVTLPLDLMLGGTGPEQAAKECPYEYEEWINDSLC